MRQRMQSDLPLTIAAAKTGRNSNRYNFYARCSFSVIVWPSGKMYLKACRVKYRTGNSGRLKFELI